MQLVQHREYNILSMLHQLHLHHNSNVKLKNRPTFAKVTVKIKVAQFFVSQCICINHVVPIAHMVVLLLRES